MFRYLLVTLPLLDVSLTLGWNRLFANREDIHEGRIAGGDNADIEDYPYNVAYHWKNRETREFRFCSGAIVSQFFVVTAARCVIDLKNTSLITLRVGDSDRRYGKSSKVNRIFIHPDYEEQGCDVAMLNVQHLNFNSKVQPVKLPDPNVTPEHSILVTGWGKVADEETLPSKLLRVVELDPLSSSMCDMDSKFMYCAAQPGKGICPGDAGAPAIVKGTTVLCGLGLPDMQCSVGPTPSKFIEIGNPTVLDFITATISTQPDIT